MQSFEFVRVDDPAAAIAAAAKANSAQQGANIRFIAGGTTLFDLMKLNVERPRKWSTSTTCHSTRSSPCPMVD